MPRTEPIKPWEVTRLFLLLRKLGCLLAHEKYHGAGLSGAFGPHERCCLRHLWITGLPAGKLLGELRSFFSDMDIEGTTIEEQLWDFRDLLPPGAHLTPEERIDALARKLVSVAAQMGKTFAPGTVPEVNGRVPDALVTWFYDELSELMEGIDSKHAGRIIRGFEDYGFAPEYPEYPPYVSGTPEYTNTCSTWWSEAFASYRNFGPEWEK